jgi:5-methylcytosine-specific restriction endonuclease McrA
MSSTTRVMKGGRADQISLPKGPAGRNLCRWCNLEVPPGRLTFCSEWCVNEWRLRSDPGYLRNQVFERDRGVCALCGTDTVAEWRRIRHIRGARRLAALDVWGLRRLTRRTLWDADHVVPVVEGGGECDLENIRTLCLRCHRQVTAELRMRRKGESGPERANEPGPL